ncbi:hypothetical protein V2J09_016228 [Rumex salicifolius]
MGFMKTPNLHSQRAASRSHLFTSPPSRVPASSFGRLHNSPPPFPISSLRPTMTLLEVIAKAAAANQQPITSEFPFAFDPERILNSLTPEPLNPDNRFSLVEPLNGFRISDSNSEVAKVNKSLFKKLKPFLNAKTSSGSRSSAELTELLVSSLKEIGRSLRIPIKKAEIRSLVEAAGAFLSQDVIERLIDSCVSLENWEVLETLISNKLVKGIQSQLLSKLMEKNCSNLVCLCVKSFSDDLNWSDLLAVLKYLLSPSKEAHANMATVRKSWEDEALLAVKLAGSKDLTKKKQSKAKEAAILLMVAYDGFSAPELCLHYLLSSTKAADDIVFSGAISKLSLDEILGLIKYLGKWLGKYERFPEAIPCLEAQTVLDLSMCHWVPSVETVAEALGVVLDEWFSSLVLHVKFHQELKSVERVLSSLVMEGRLCASVACLIDISKSQADLAS